MALSPEILRQLDIEKLKRILDEIQITLDDHERKQIRNTAQISPPMKNNTAVNGNYVVPSSLINFTNNHYPSRFDPKVNPPNPHYLQPMLHGYPCYQNLTPSPDLTLGSSRFPVTQYNDGYLDSSMMRKPDYNKRIPSTKALNCNEIKPNYTGPTCRFCEMNGEEDVYHKLKDSMGNTRCPVLRKFVCKLCGATGDSGHTQKFCPKNPFTRGDPIKRGFPPGLLPSNITFKGSVTIEQTEDKRNY